MGTAELACASLLGIKRAPGFTILAAVTQPDKPVGRRLQLQPSPVKKTALAQNIPVLQPPRARDENFIAQLRELAPDIIIVVAYGQILPPAILNLPRFGCVNVHTSLLPRFRGASPIQSALLVGDAETGVTIMQMDAGLDTGPILTQAKTEIRDDDNAATLHDRLAQLGAELLVPTVRDFADGKISPKPQPADGVTHAAKIKKSDGQLDWNQPARVLWNRLRAFTPWPGTFTFLPGQPPRLLKILRAEITTQAAAPGEIISAEKSGIVIGCGADALRILELQIEGGRRMNAAEFLAGHRLEPGTRL